MVLGHPKRVGSTNGDAGMSDSRSDARDPDSNAPDQEGVSSSVAGSALGRAMTESGFDTGASGGVSSAAAKLRARMRLQDPDTSTASSPPSNRATDADVDQFTDEGSAEALVRVHPDMPKVNPNLVFGSTMALWQPPRFTPQELVDTINEILEGTGTSAQFDEGMGDIASQPKFSLLKRRLKGPPSAVLRINGLKTLVGGGDKPAFTGKALADRVNPALWADGVQRLSSSRGHVMIADAQPNDPDDPDLRRAA